jgi:nucleoside-diphosphate-sugar epimerase
MQKILIIGALGQIGSELAVNLSEKYGTKNVVIADISNNIPEDLKNNPFEIINITDKENIREVILKHKIDSIINLAAILSAKGEDNPQMAWHINVTGFMNTLELAMEYKLDRIMTPSSIAVFGPESMLYNTPQNTILKPRTMYGITKVTGELLSEYYFNKFNLDIRGIRYPGIISHKTLPGGGTTDYAVEIFYEAIKHKKYTCFVSEDTCLPMMYMPDCVDATIQLLEADRNLVKHHGDYNVVAMSFTAGELAAEIKKHIPEFEIEYKPDFRREIARYWPASIDDSSARADWGWKHKYGLSEMVEDMLTNIRKKIEQE